MYTLTPYKNFVTIGQFGQLLKPINSKTDMKASSQANMSYLGPDDTGPSANQELKKRKKKVYDNPIIRSRVMYGHT